MNVPNILVTLGRRWFKMKFIAGRQLLPLPASWKVAFVDELAQAQSRHGAGSLSVYRIKNFVDLALEFDPQTI